MKEKPSDLLKTLIKAWRLLMENKKKKNNEELRKMLTSINEFNKTVILTEKQEEIVKMPLPKEKLDMRLLNNKPFTARVFSHDNLPTPSQMALIYEVDEEVREMLEGIK